MVVADSIAGVVIRLGVGVFLVGLGNVSAVVVVVLASGFRGCWLEFPLLLWLLRKYYCCYC